MSAQLNLEHVKSSLYRLRNISGEDVTVAAVDNLDEFFRIDLEPRTTLQAGRSTDFLIAGAMGRPVPGEIVLTLEGTDSPVVVPIPPKP